MKTIKLTHKQAMEVVACLDTLQGMGGTLDEDFNKDCDTAGKLSDVITKQLEKLGYVKPPFEYNV